MRIDLLVLLLKMRQMMLYLENHFGAAIDVEFCVKDSVLCLLQVRPLVLNEEQLLIYNSGFAVADNLSVSLQTISSQAPSTLYWET